MDRETALDRLAAVPLADFVAERKKLAKELRDAGDGEAAAEIAKLAKPTPPAWALNHLAREEPERVAGWLDAAEALREASAGGGGDALRGAIAAHREATRALVAELRGSLSEPMLDRVRALLQTATVDPDAAERLRAGRLVEGDDDEAGAESAGKATSKPARKRTTKASSKAAAETADEATAKEAAGAAADEAADATAEKADEAAEREAAEREAEERAAAERAELERRAGAVSAELERVREEVAEREAAAAAADERVEEARRTLTRSESEAAAAHSAADDAREALEDAERAVRALIARLRDAS